jgi:hypothetical protein
MALAFPHIQRGKGQSAKTGKKTTTRCGGGVVLRQRLFCFYMAIVENTYMNARSMFAIYLYEDSDGNLSVRADSYGQGEKAFNLGLDLLRLIKGFNQQSGGDIMLLPIDRCEAVQ